MASYNELNALIDAYINRNGVQAITGQILNGVLKAMVEQLGRGYTIMGAADPTTDPGTPDGPESYFASEVGTYTNFGGLQIVPGELALLCYTPSDGWSKETIYEGFQQVTAQADDNIGVPSVGVSYSNGVLSFNFRNIKGKPGENGQDGDPAGFGQIGADITGGVGTPGVSVESSGPATAKNLQFHFTNLKGETGVTSVVATVDNTTGTPACTVSLVGQQLTLAFTGLKGAQGDTGSSVDYPFTIVNNLTTDDATQALSAAQGVVLDGKVSQLEAKVDELAGETGIAVGYSLVANEYVSASDGSFLSFNGWSRTDYIDISAYSSIKIEGTATGYNYFYAADKSPVSSLNLALTGSTLDLSNYPTAKYLVLSDSSANMANLSITVLGYRGDTIVSLGTRVSALETDSNNFSSLPQDGLAFVKRIKSVGESGYITIPFDIPIVLPKGMALKLKVSGVTINSGTIAAYFKDGNNQYYSANSTGEDIERTFTFNEDKTIVEYGINKDDPSVVFSAEVIFAAGYIADLDGVESELSGISQQVETNTDNISELQEKTIGVTNNHNASELTSTNYYSLSDGTLQGQSGSYASGEFNLSANIAKITASFPTSNWSFGILLYDESDNFIASYHADTSIEINLAGLGAAKAIIQNYSGWDETVFAFVGENHISSLETDVETIKGKVAPEYTTIVATRNADDYNSIREIIANITDATPAHKYIVFVPVGRWFECDIQGKENVSIVGEDRERTILYCDGTSSNLTPAGYSYPAVGGGVALSSVNQQYKHCIFAKSDIDISNLTIEVNDAKYCVHLDNPNWSNVVIKNCHLTAKANTNYAVGVGINGGQKIDIQNTVIERTTSEGGVFLHNWNNQSAPSNINIDKCYFKGCDFGTIDELGSEQDDEWLITNCYSSKTTPSIRWMVDHDGDGNTYWVNPETGEREPNPQAVPYCIKLNTLGSNVKSVVKAGYNGTSVIARPNCLDYMISNFDLIQ